MEWTTIKPTKSCLFMTATFSRKQWMYEVWELKKAPKGEEDRFENGLILLDRRGDEEYFGASKIKADKYLILPAPPQKPKL